MLTSREYFLVKLYVSLPCKFCVINADWDEASELLKEGTSKWKTTCHRLFLGLCWLWFIFGVWRHERIFISKTQEHDIIHKIVYTLFFVTYVLAILLQMSFSVSSHSLIELYNQLLVCCRKLGISNQRTKRERLLIYLQILAATDTFVVALGYSYIEMQYIWKLTSNIPLAILTGLIFLPFLIGCVMKFLTLQMHMFMYFVITKSMLLIRKDSPENVLTAEQVDGMVLSYKSLFILSNGFNQSFCKTVVPCMKYFMLGSAMMCVVAAIRIQHMDIIGTSRSQFSIVFFCMGSYFCVLLAMFAGMSSNFWSTSKEYIWKFKTITSKVQSDEFVKKYNKLSATGLQSLRFGVGGIYYMEKKAKLTMAESFIEGTADLLLTFQ